MPNYKLIPQLAIRELTISLYGTDIKLTERLFKNPERIQKARAQILDFKDSLSKVIEKRKAKAEEPKDDDADTVQLQTLLDQADYALASNERYALCETFCEQIIATDLTDESGMPMPLDVEGLFAADVPSEMLQAILDAVNAVPPVPKASK